MDQTPQTQIPRTPDLMPDLTRTTAPASAPPAETPYPPGIRTTWRGLPRPTQTALVAVGGVSVGFLLLLGERLLILHLATR